MDNQPKKRVLIVDDEVVARKELVDKLKDDYRLIIAENGEDALKKAFNEENRPDIILLDIKLPDKHGYNVGNELKANPKTWYIPVIFITQFDATVLKEEFLEYGGCDFITKPFDPINLKIRIKVQLDLNNKLRAYHKSFCELYEYTKALASPDQVILKSQEKLISRLEAIIKSPFSGEDNY
jgi:response regulator RpfG family c-di-GMP phosphodiesterase